MRRTSTFFLLLGLTLAATAVSAHAQRVYWEPSHGALGLDKIEQLTLVFDQCGPTEDVTLPKIEGLEFLGRNYQERRINTSLQVSWIYSVQATRRGPVVIPAFDVRTNRGTLAVGEVRFDVGDAAIGQTGTSINDLIKAYIRPARATLWAGEIVEIEYIILGVMRYSWQITSLPEWKPAGLLLEPWDEGERVEAPVNGQVHQGFRFRTRAMAMTAGTLTLDPVKQNVRVQTGDRTTFSFAQPRFEAFTVASDQPELTIRALPQPAPAGFNGLVGSFQLESKVVPENTNVGAPITWTLALRGTGNWPLNPTLPEREVAADFQVVQPQPRQQMDDNRLFSGSLTEDAVLVPTRAGTYTLGPVAFAYFDTSSGDYRNATIAPATVKINPAVAPANLAPTPGAPDAGPGSGRGGDPALSGSTVLPEDLIPPAALPRDPLRTGESGLAPVKMSGTWWFLLALAAPLATWLGLAWRQMLRGDEARRRHAVRRELQQLLRTWQMSGTIPDAAGILRWRGLTTKLLGVNRAAPTTDDITDALAAIRTSDATQEWVALWREAETAMFSPAATLPTDWVSRAVQAARDFRIKSAGPPVPVRLRHWSPRIAAVLGLAFLFVATLRAADDPASRAYREGDFASAALGWEARLAREPHDWAAHNNLALARAQQQDWNQAAAHWTTAFLLNPREPSIRANLRLALSRLDGIDPELRRLVEGSALDRAITILSPGEWQLLFFLGAAAIATGGVLWVGALYRPRTSRWKLAGGIVVTTGVLLSLAGVTGLRLYGPLADPGAGFVTAAGSLHSIPTDLAEHQQTSPISPGAIVVTQGAFLGWDRVVVGRGTPGWLRRENIIPFYHAPTKSDAPAPAAAPAPGTL